MSRVDPNDFYEFLNKHKMEERWVAHIASQEGEDYTSVSQHPKLYNREPHNWIIKAFDWNITSEGYEHWEKLHAEWLRELDVISPKTYTLSVDLTLDQLIDAWHRLNIATGTLDEADYDYNYSFCKGSDATLWREVNELIPTGTSKENK